MLWFCSLCECCGFVLCVNVVVLFFVSMLWFCSLCQCCGFVLCVNVVLFFVRMLWFCSLCQCCGFVLLLLIALQRPPSELSAVIRYMQLYAEDAVQLDTWSSPLFLEGGHYTLTDELDVWSL